MSVPAELRQAANLPITTGQLRNVIANADTLIKVGKLKDSTPFLDAGADSLDLFNIILAVEDAYGLRIPSEDIAQAANLDHLAAYLNQRLS